VFVCGGMAYIVMIVKNGLWEISSNRKSTVKKDAGVSILCGVIFSILFDLFLFRIGLEYINVLKYGLMFWAGISVVSFLLLRGLDYLNHKKKN